MASPDVGQIAPDFTLPSSTGSTWTLSDAAAHRPQVVIFYRGHW